MFSHQLEESKLNRVEIADFDADVIKEMLQFIYTGTSPNLDKYNGRLLAIADKYELSRLKYSCANSLIRNINIENAGTALALAELHSSKKLFDVAVEFIKSNEKSIIATESWKNVSETNGALVQKYLLAKYEICVEITRKRKRSV
ncbi:speckle-type POZ protein-like [Drosophila busckii]|uniref:speckle-type POZ protein-like n=1 Tax=Drosophila busckii TaxID=30019 RepID=UPI001432D84E|nr:speckle-type POZ protein-like [Drosophila busckii]